MGHEPLNLQEFAEFSSLAVSSPVSPRPYSPDRPPTGHGGKRINILRLEEDSVGNCLRMP